jgi:ABC-type multidrug transport system ATPase subunit
MNISIQHLSKVYANGKRALNDINLEIKNGLFGLLGPNGAGKTTLMRILVTLMKPTSGTVRVDHLDLQRQRKSIRRMLGYLPQEFSTFPKVKTWEFLDYSARLADINSSVKRRDLVDQYLEKVGLFDARDRLANKLSGGMKRRLGIAQALIGDPKILVVDEPTTGLDPEERIRFRNLLTDMGQEERIIILSTHIVGDISSTCREMALLVDGEVGFNGAPDELIKQAEGNVFQIDATDAELGIIQERFAVISIIPSEQGWKVQIVAESIEGFTSVLIEPNLEHAYVNFIEKRYKLEDKQEILDLDFKDDTVA